MAIHLAALSWALIFILRLPFPPGKSIAKVILNAFFSIIMYMAKINKQIFHCYSLLLLLFLSLLIPWYELSGYPVCDSAQLEEPDKMTFFCFTCLISYNVKTIRAVELK